MTPHQVYVLPITKALTYDLAFIAHELKRDPQEWLRDQVNERIQAEKVRLIEDFEDAFEEGRLTPEEFAAKTGLPITQELLRRRQNTQEQRAKTQEANKKGFQNFITNALETTTQQPQHHDKHMKRIIRNLEHAKRNAQQTTPRKKRGRRSYERLWRR